MAIRKIYLLPNALTTGNLVCGILSILISTDGVAMGAAADSWLFAKAAWLILLGMLLDGLDGRVASLTKSSSSFGVNYDSMADLVTFGIAPVMLLINMDVVAEPFSFSMAIVYTSCAALRLARFNVQVNREEKGDFRGLPSPTPAALIAAFVLTLINYRLAINGLFVFAGVIVLGVLMVSNLRYPSLKSFKLQQHKPFEYTVMVTIAFAVAILWIQMAILTAATAYVLCGLVMNLRDLVASRRRSTPDTDLDDA